MPKHNVIYVDTIVCLSDGLQGLSRCIDGHPVGFKTFFLYLLSFSVFSPRGTGRRTTSFICRCNIMVWRMCSLENLEVKF